MVKAEGGVEGSKKSLLRFVPARSDAIVRIVLACTVKEKFEVNFGFNTRTRLEMI